MNPFENFVEAAFDFNQMKSTRKFLSEKLVSYAEAYLKHLKSSPGVTTELF